MGRQTLPTLNRARLAVVSLCFHCAASYLAYRYETGIKLFIVTLGKQANKPISQDVELFFYIQTVLCGETLNQCYHLY